MMQQTSRLLATAVFALAALAPLGALAQAPAEPGNAPADPAGHSGPASAQATQASTPAATLTDGEVRRIDRDAGKLTLRHGEIKHLDMPPMTMVFVARDKALLDTVKVGDRIRFRVVMEGSQMVVTDLQPAP